MVDGIQHEEEEKQAAASHKPEPHNGDDENNKYNPNKLSELILHLQLTEQQAMEQMEILKKKVSDQCHLKKAVQGNDGNQRLRPNNNLNQNNQM